MSLKTAIFTLIFSAAAFLACIYLTQRLPEGPISENLANYVAPAALLMIFIACIRLLENILKAVSPGMPAPSSDDVQVSKLTAGARALVWMSGGFFLWVFAPRVLGVSIFPYATKNPVFLSPVWWFSLLCSGLAIWAILYSVKAKLRWDAKQVSVTDIMLRTQTRDWVDLQKVVYDKDAFCETKFRFTGSGSLWIFGYFEGRDDVIACAKDRLDNA